MQILTYLVAHVDTLYDTPDSKDINVFVMYRIKSEKAIVFTKPLPQLKLVVNAVETKCIYSKV